MKYQIWFWILVEVLNGLILTFPAWGAAGLLTYLAELIARTCVVRNLTRSGCVASELTRKIVFEGGIARFDDHRMTDWSALQHRLESVGSRLKIIHIASAALGIATGWLVMSSAYENSVIKQGYPFWQQAAQAEGYVLLVVISVFIASHYRVRHELLSNGVEILKRRPFALTPS